LHGRRRIIGEILEFLDIQKNQFDKTEELEHTITRIQDILVGLGLEYQYTETKVSECLYWSSLRIPEFQFRVTGKGTSRELSKASTLAEAMERLSGSFLNSCMNPYYFKFFGQELADIFSHKNLKGYERGKGDPKFLRSLLKNASLTEEEFGELQKFNIAQDWIDGYSFMSGKTVKVPLSLVELISNSNGLAAGNTIEEAILQGACECFERYAILEALENRSHMVEIDSETIPSETIQTQLRFFKNNNFDVTIKDASLTRGLPVKAIFFRNKNVSPKIADHESMVFGGAFNSEVAISRCFTEKVQGKTLEFLKNPINEFVKPKLAKVKNRFDVIACGVYQENITDLEYGERVTFYNKNLTTVEELEYTKCLCTMLKTDFIVVNLSKFGFPVVRVIMPGISDTLRARDNENRSLAEVLYSTEDGVKTIKTLNGILDRFRR